MESCGAAGGGCGGAVGCGCVAQLIMFDFAHAVVTLVMQFVVVAVGWDSKKASGKETVP